ncbi:FliI/YscN family ATPase [Cysteiniphilum litorale]|uniref:FliI/YscN family ATPase n=1 Tax=Cysteiniphilum litorale TaxID=2056700 RepID=UPI003F88061A
MMKCRVEPMIDAIFKTTQPYLRCGYVKHIYGNIIEASCPPQSIVGDICRIKSIHHEDLLAEIIGFNDNKAILMPYSSSYGVMVGARITICDHANKIQVSDALLGQVVDAFAKPLTDDVLISGQSISTQISAINPVLRQPINERLATGVAVIDSLMPLGKGQRIGIFAGSGVGKSTLLNMIAQHCQQQICVIALIGERGREVHDFLNTLSADKRQHIVTVVATSDQSALLRKQAAYTATAIAQYFAQQGHDVLLMMDSITRLAMAQREIGLAIGEMPTARGYTASTFSILPQLLECCGRFKEQGSISAIYTILVEGDDLNEPIADYMRASLDGHIVLNRELAHSGQYPAIDILKSTSRLFHQLTDPEIQTLVHQLKAQYQLVHKYQDMIALGAYAQGSNSALDTAIQKVQALNRLFAQTTDQSMTYDKVITEIKAILKD